MRPRALADKFALLLFYLLLSFVLITFKQGEASSGDEFTRKEVSGVVFENSVFHYYSKNYTLSAFQFRTLFEEFPEFKKSEVLGYYLSSLSFLGRDRMVEEYIEKYKNILKPEVIFTLSNNFQKRGKHKAALDALESVKLSGLSPVLRGKYYFLKARSQIALDLPVEAFKSLGEIKKSSAFYVEARLLLSRLHYKMNEAGKAVSLLVELLGDEKDRKKNRNSRESENLNKAALLLGQLYFEKENYRKALSYFSRVGEGEYLSSAIEGISWVRIKLGEYKRAAKKLKVIKNRFPRYYYDRDLPMRTLLTHYYSGKWGKTKKSLEELDAFISEKSSLSKSIIESDDLSKKYIYYLLENFSGIQLIEKYSLTAEDIKLFQLFDPDPELISISEIYRLLEQMRKENIRGLNLFNDYAAVFRKRRELFKSFIDLFRYLKPSYLSLKKTIMEIEIPFDKIPAKNVKYVSTSLDMALNEYARNFKRPLTKVESQLVKILVYEEYVSYKGIDRNLPLFTLTLKMMKALQGLYGESGKGWKDDFNNAVDEHNKSVRMINKLNSFPMLNKELKKIKSDITSIITAYLRKEAYRIITRNKLYSDMADAIREDLLPETLKKINDEKEGLSPSDEIELYLKGKISFLDNYSSGLLLFFADRLFEQEFESGKNVFSSGRRREAGNYSVSFKKTIEFLDEIIEKRGDDRFIDRFLYLRGYCYLEQGDHDRAFEDFLRIEEEFTESPLFSEVSFRLAEYYFSSEQLALAIETYEKVLKEKKSPYYDKALYKLGWAYYLASNFYEAIGYFMKLADQSYSLKKGEYVDAVSSWGGQAELDSEDLSYEGLVYAALSYTNTGDADEVLKRLSENVKPYSGILLSELAHAYFDQSRYTDFLKVYDEFVTLFKIKNIPPVLRMEKAIVNIRELDRSDKREALKRKEMFVERYHSYTSSPEMMRYREKLDLHLRPMIRELASFFHKQAVETETKDLFKKAGGYYLKYLDLYPKEKDSKIINLYYAESLYELGEYLAAASEFEKVGSFDFGDLSVNEKALYGAVASLENTLKELEITDLKKREKVEAKLIEAEKKYTYIFPKEKKSGPLYFRQGKRLFKKKKYKEAISFFEKAGALLLNLKEKGASYEYLADSYFNSREFYRAHAEYQKLLERSKRAGDKEGELKAREYISRANVNIAEELTQNGKVELGARRYELASEAFFKSDDKERVLVKAMRLYISIRRWEEFDRVYGFFRSIYPERARLRKTLLLAANLARENFDFVTSGKYFERLSSLEDDQKEKHKILLAAASEYEKGNNIKTAVRIYSALYKMPSVSEAQQLEFRYKAAKLLEREGEGEEAEKLYLEVLSLHRKYAEKQGLKKGRGNRYYFGRASLRLLRKPFDKFVSTSLLPPFSENFAKRLGVMGELLKRFMEIAKLDITEFSTQSLYRIGALLESFRKSIIESSPPSGLSEEEKEEYMFMLEERAFPYEERAVKAYEKSISIGRKKGVSDRYIDLCYDRLAGISPAVYKREEDIFISKVVPLPHPFGFIGKIDFERFSREKDEFYFETETR